MLKLRRNDNDMIESELKAKKTQKLWTTVSTRLGLVSRVYAAQTRPMAKQVETAVQSLHFWLSV